MWQLQRSRTLSFKYAYLTFQTFKQMEKIGRLGSTIVDPVVHRFSSWQHDAHTIGVFCVLVG